MGTLNLFQRKELGPSLLRSVSCSLANHTEAPTSPESCLLLRSFSVAVPGRSNRCLIFYVPVRRCMGKADRTGKRLNNRRQEKLERLLGAGKVTT